MIEVTLRSKWEAVMIVLFIIGYFAGVIAGVSPCIVPVLPVVFVAWADPAVSAPSSRHRRRRSLAIVAGVTTSFSIITALGSEILSVLGLPQVLWHDLGIGVLVIFGVSLLVPTMGEWLERPFARFARSGPTGTRSAFALGLGLGLVFVPCAGPVLAAVSILGARHHASVASVLLSVFFAAGAATPLLIIGLAGDRLIERSRRVGRVATRLRPVAGSLLLAMAVVITFNLAAGLQTALPSYTHALERWIEGNSFTTTQLRQLQGEQGHGSLAQCENVAATASMPALADCGVAPALTGITGWLNTPHDQPVTLRSLRGHVVLIDFWTYTCINCRRSVPHVEAWYQRYHRDGFDVIGVAAPEFAFEHEIGNIAAGAASLHLTYPLAVDDNLATWTAYSNEYWPAEYLIDATGVIRHVAYGEGDYDVTESAIRSLLTAAHPSLTLPSPTSVPNLTPTDVQSPETYLGTQQSQYLANGTMTPNATQSFTLPSQVPSQSYVLGGTWHTEPEFITAVSDATLALNFSSSKVYLVLSGSGTVSARLDGRALPTVHVHGFPTLYTLVSLPSATSGTLTLHLSPGVSAYDFTFG